MAVQAEFCLTTQHLLGGGGGEHPPPDPDFIVGKMKFTKGTIDLDFWVPDNPPLSGLGAAGHTHRIHLGMHEPAQYPSLLSASTVTSGSFHQPEENGEVKDATLLVPNVCVKALDDRGEETKGKAEVDGAGPRDDDRTTKDSTSEEGEDDNSDDDSSTSSEGVAVPRHPSIVDRPMPLRQKLSASIGRQSPQSPL